MPEARSRSTHGRTASNLTCRPPRTRKGIASFASNANDRGYRSSDGRRVFVQLVASSYA
jgi:hypothetical protein